MAGNKITLKEYHYGNRKTIIISKIISVEPYSGGLSGSSLINMTNGRRQESIPVQKSPDEIKNLISADKRMRILWK